MAAIVSMPQTGTVNPILAGTELVTALNAIAGCNSDPLETVALSVGVFRRVARRKNIIPDTAAIGRLGALPGRAGKAGRIQPYRKQFAEEFVRLTTRPILWRKSSVIRRSSTIRR